MSVLYFSWIASKDFKNTLLCAHSKAHSVFNVLDGRKLKLVFWGVSKTGGPLHLLPNSFHSQRSLFLKFLALVPAREGNTGNQQDQLVMAWAQQQIPILHKTCKIQKLLAWVITDITHILFQTPGLYLVKFENLLRLGIDYHIPRL